MVGVPDARWGEVGCAYLVTARRTIAAEAVAVSIAAARLARYKAPDTRAFRRDAAPHRLGQGPKDELRRAFAGTARRDIMSFDKRRDSLRRVLVDAVRQMAGQPAAPACDEVRRHVCKAEMARRDIDPSSVRFRRLRHDQDQYQSFYGAPWPLYEMGGLKQRRPHDAPRSAPPAPRVVFAGAAEIQLGMASLCIAFATDRCSNGPHIYYPAPRGIGGTGQNEDPMVYNFTNDAIGGHSMLETAENVAKKYSISTEQQHEVVLRRYRAIPDALADDRAFHKPLHDTAVPGAEAQLQRRGKDDGG